MWDLSVPGNNDRDFHVETAVVAVLVQNDDGCPTSPNRMQRQVSRRQVPSHPGGTATATPTAGGGSAPKVRDGIEQRGARREVCHVRCRWCCIPWSLM